MSGNTAAPPDRPAHGRSSGGTGAYGRTATESPSGRASRELGPFLDAAVREDG
ncbi:hypothetical protein [Streptomyces bicolor]|uniref:hypothetical protein n=1 Tax=Streptomyces bicolor TaxID=66874 RepID=UPI00131B325D|nr:hypothetical protein [Streptomyces bicolor]